MRRAAPGLRGFRILTASGLAICGMLAVWRCASGGRGELSPLSGRINPNTAPAGSLIRLEGIGAARAFDIIEYREAREALGERAFDTPHDLEAVRGIGPKTVEKLTDSLEF